MKEYDIFLKKQPEGEIIVYMLTYYANFSVRNGLLIDVDAHEKALKKLSISNRLGLQAKVAGTKKRAFERVQNGIGISASPNFLVRKYVEYVEPSIINIKTPEIDVVPVMLLDGVNSGIEVTQSLSELKYEMEKFSNEFQVQANIAEMAKVVFEQYDDGFVLEPAVDDLLYRDIHFNGASAIELAASASAALKRYRLLIELDNNCILGSMIPLSDIDTDAISAIDNRSLLELMYQMSTEHPFIDTTLIQGYIFLREIDDKSLADIDGEILDKLSHTIPSDLPYIDNMTLEELDYVIFED